mgnify:CR=1 FL=1
MLLWQSLATHIGNSGENKKYYVVSNVSLDRYKINEVLNEMEVIASEGDVDILQRVCAVVSVRAARLAAAGVVAIAKVTWFPV